MNKARLNNIAFSMLFAALVAAFMWFTTKIPDVGSTAWAAFFAFICAWPVKAFLSFVHRSVIAAIVFWLAAVSLVPGFAIPAAILFGGWSLLVRSVGWMEDLCGQELSVRQLNKRPYIPVRNRGYADLPSDSAINEMELRKQSHEVDELIHNEESFWDRERKAEVKGLRPYSLSLFNPFYDD